VKTDRKNNKWIILSKKDTSSDCMLVKYDDREFKIILNLPYIPVLGLTQQGIHGLSLMISLSAQVVKMEGY
jgi:hypothetical protein